MKFRYGLVIVLLLIFIACSTLAQASSNELIYGITFDTGNLIQIDPATNSPISTFGVATTPNDIIGNPSGTALYVSDDATNRIIILNPSTGAIIGNISLPTHPYDLAINSLGTTLYVTDNSSKVYVISLSSNTITATISLAANSCPESIAITPDNSKVCVAEWNGNKIDVISTTTNTVSGTIGLGSAPYPSDIIISPDSSKLYAVLNYNSFSTPGLLIEFSLNPISALNQVNIQNYPLGVCIDKTGAFIYTTSSGPTVGQQRIQKFDNNLVFQNNITITYSSSPYDYPFYPRVDPNTNNVYIPHGQNISVYSPTSNTIISTITMNYGELASIAFTQISASAAINNPIAATINVNGGGWFPSNYGNENVSIYNPQGQLVNTVITDSSGNAPFVLVPGVMYTYSVSGSDIKTTTGSLYVKASQDTYTIIVSSSHAWWDPLGWFSYNSSATNNIPQGTVFTGDVTRDINSKINGTMINASAGLITCVYSDVGNGTTALTYNLYSHTNKTNVYTLLSSTTVYPSSSLSITNTFTVYDAPGNTYLLSLNGSNTYYGQISRSGVWTAPVNTTWNLGWPDDFKMFVSIGILITIVALTARRNLIAGLWLTDLVGWFLFGIGMMGSMGLWAPTGLGICLCLLVVKVVAEWRDRNQV